jgi:predicted RecB family nuclease
MRITTALFDAFLKCATKCHLRSLGETGSGNEYAEWVRGQEESYQRDAAQRLQETVPENQRAGGPPDTENLKAAKWRLAVDLVAQTPYGTEDSPARESPPHEERAEPEGPCSEQPLESRLHAVERVPSEGRGKPAQFVPIRFVFRNKLTKDDRLLLAFDAMVLSQVLGREISLGKIIHGDDHTTLKVKTSALVGEVRKRLEKSSALLASPAPPDLVLNRHCAECEFQARCRKIAVEKDDLSLLAGMSAKERKKLHSKGIFTVTQLSYTFRPRRRPKRLRDKREKYHHSLKALAIREKKIHIVGSPELKVEGTPVYLDVEGLPDRDFYYLIGLRIGNGETAVQHSLWADTVADEGKIWREFLGILDSVEQPVLIHYGSYETIFARIMRQRHGSPRASSIAAAALDGMVNVLAFVFAQVYFPTYSNNIKDLAGWLGFAWPDPALFGPNSIRCRFEWQRTHEAAIRESLTAYNVADCQALCFLCQHLTALSSDQSPNPQRGKMDLVNVDQMKPLTGFHLMNRDGAALPAFKAINKAAYWDYQRTRVYVRTSKIIKKACRHSPGVRPKLPVRRIVRYPAPCSCSSCGGTDLFRGRATNLLAHDIRFMKSGAKGWLTRAVLDNWFCRDCRCLVRPPGIGAFAVRKFGPHLRAYAMYQLIQLRISGITVAESLSQLFHFDLM